MFLTQKTFIPFIDCALLSKETVDGNEHFLEKAIYIEESPKDVIKKLYMSKTIMIHPDIYDKWTDIILVLVQKKHLEIDNIIICGSDYFIEDEILDVMFAFFPNTKFYVQNYLGFHKQCKLLPIGVIINFTNPIIKSKLCKISYVNYNSCYREEFYEFLSNNTEFMKEYYTSITDINTYIQNLSELYFTVCPMGNGFDTFRFWEALMVKTIPIVKKHIFYNTLRHYYPKVPFIEIETWDELPSLVESLTIEKYEIMIKDIDIECLKESYWINQIKSDYIKVPQVP
jgi:hypothetical protein